jgi:hypothetical protein
VYGDPDNACYEWRVIGGGQTHDTGTEVSGGITGRQYGQAETALLDALLFVRQHEEVEAEAKDSYCSPGI